MVKANAIKRVEEGKTTLYFMGFNHALQDIFHRQGLAFPSKVICNSKNCTQVI
jgi:hypothetical protein